MSYSEILKRGGDFKEKVRVILSWVMMKTSKKTKHEN